MESFKGTEYHRLFLVELDKRRGKLIRERDNINRFYKSATNNLTQLLRIENDFEELNNLINHHLDRYLYSLPASEE